MPRPVGYGRPGRPVIPTTWAETHRPVVEHTLTGTGTIRPPGATQVWSDELEQMVEQPHLASYAGRCRVQALGTRAPAVITAEDAESVADYLVVFPADADPTPGHLVTVTDTGDPALDGAVLVIERVVLGTHRFERDLFCRLTT